MSYKAAKNQEQLEKLLLSIDAAESNSYGSDDDGELAEECGRNIARYLGKNIIPAPDGRSSAQDTSVYDTVAQMKPSITRIFAGGDEVIRLPPVGPEDEEGAKQEGEYLNYIALQKNNWFQIIDTASTDALTVKRAYLHPYVEKRRQVETERYERQTAEGLALILQDEPEVIAQEEYPDPDYVEPPPQVSVDPMTGMQVVIPPPPPPMLYDVEIKRTKVDVNYCILVLPPERCKVAKATRTVQLNPGCPYFEYYDFPTISELRADGYKMPDGSEIPDDIGQGDGDVETVEGEARDQYEELPEGDENPADPSLRRVKCRWVWIRHDFDADGIAELQHAVVVARTVLHREEVNRIPVGVLCPDPNPHRHIGGCPADRAAQTQDQNTVLLRQGIDNLQISNNPLKYGDPNKINLDDATVSRPGAFMRTRNGAIFGQDFGVMPIPNIFPQVIEGLQFNEYLNKKRTGVDFSFQGLDPNQLSQLQPGTVNQISGMTAMRVEHVARHFANGIEETFSILHELILKSGHKKEVVKLRGEWVEVDPATWRTRTDFRIAVGYSAGNKDSQMARINMLASMQKEALTGGLRICTEENAYNTAIELTKAADFPNPDMFWTDPKSLPPPQPPRPDPTVIAMEQIKAQSADNVKRMDVEQKERDSVRDDATKRYEIEVDANLKLGLANSQAQQAAQIEAQRGEQAAGLEHIRASLNPKTIEAGAKAKETVATTEILRQVQESNAQQTQAILAAMQELARALSAPRVIDRDKSGRATGSRIAQ